VNDVEQLKDIGSDLAEPARKKRKYLSARSVENRKKMPTTFKDSTIQIGEKVARSRREETYQAALEIRGGGGGRGRGVNQQRLVYLIR
jgi:hypothetical protein